MLCKKLLRSFHQLKAKNITVKRLTLLLPLTLKTRQYYVQTLEGMAKKDNTSKISSRKKQDQIAYKVTCDQVFDKKDHSLQQPNIWSHDEGDIFKETKDILNCTIKASGKCRVVP